VATTVTGFVLGLLGLLLAAGGGWLAALGGSWAYIGLGLGLTVTGVLLLRHRRDALAVYAALLLATLVWALWEVGLDRWALVPRGALFALLGLWLLTPWVDRPLGAAHRTPAAARSGWRGPRGALAGVMVLLVLTALLSMARDGFGQRGSVQTPPAGSVPADDWHAYGGSGFGQRYSALTDITPQTVQRLEPAWTFHTGDTRRPTDPAESTFEVTPLKIGDTLYLCTPHSWVIALDAATGRERWRFDPQVNVDLSSQHLTCRGVSYFDGTSPAPACAPARSPGCIATAPCATRCRRCCRSRFRWAWPASAAR
jgi:quinoprotein glucose dehydrogenase